MVAISTVIIMLLWFHESYNAGAQLALDWFNFYLTKKYEIFAKNDFLFFQTHSSDEDDKGS